MKKYIVISIVFALTIVGLSQNAQIVFAEDVTAIIPTTVGSNSAEVVTTTVDSSVTAPVSVGSNSSETGAIIPNTSGTGSNETGAIIPAPVGDNTPEGTFTAPPVTPPVTPVTPPSNGGGSTSGGSSYSGGSRSSGGSVVTLANSPVALGVMTTSCPLITDYLKLGGDNNGAQVTKLQIFLKNSEKLNVDVNGIFDQKTEDAVKSFQLKYLPTILGPWDATRATGFVYITTLKKINQLACATPLTLSADDQAIIAAYKARGTVEQSSEVVTPGTTNATGTLEVGTTDNGQTAENTAAVANTSILSRFWNFIKNLFR